MDQTAHVEYAHPTEWSSSFCSGVAAILDDCPRCRSHRQGRGLPETAVSLHPPRGGSFGTPVRQADPSARVDNLLSE